MLPNILDALAQLNTSQLCASALAVAAVVYLQPYLVDSHFIRRNGITGPFFARFSDAWLGWVAAHGNRSVVVHKLHKKYGLFVRLAPNHVSISDPEALHIVYGHGSGTLKSDYYDAFLAIRHTVLTTRDREDHSMKRKLVAPIFSQKSVLGFEPCVHSHVTELFEQWDKLCDGGKQGLTGNAGKGGWKGRDGRVWFDALPWLYYMCFDIIGDLVLGAPFNMVHKGTDTVPVALEPSAVIAQYGQSSITGSHDTEKPICAVKEAPAMELMNGRSAVIASLGVLPPWWRPIASLFPWYARGNRDVGDLAGFATLAISKRLARPTEPLGLLSALLELKDDEGKPLSKEQLSADGLLLLIAGSDMVANPTCAVLYQIIANPPVQAKLQKELDDALGAPSPSDDSVSTYSQINHLPYLEAVINEALRVHPMVGLGLPRVVPASGLTVCGKHFPEGTVLSVPTYTIHRDKEVWGEDADTFRPERWFEGDKSTMQKVFNAYSYGLRACAGRVLANVELQIFISSIFRRYEFVLEEPENPVEVFEGFIMRPKSCRVGMKRRAI
ncbi:cytochrome P450 monooxygenase [Fomitiporia mediterranea MF3/22]|uniref:Cytochrome P450 monooxygenase n=1 Tax=Fomitiporia mediterranea (strain MF3/22) TaxID=694068 RepID=R7SGU9_FOMME|nr:cytochrome P450 monooxygenase [Fomitiporia mediterranea MF3/22]EJC97640.1 cytochrome P450 monooxygenase [Fomitiporia mediterranea MF3/22]